MIREWGSPTFFLTFSCAEYEASDITNYLRRVNNVPSSYDIGRLCTEDPILVSRQFSLKWRGLPVRSLTRSPTLTYIDWLLGTKCTNVVDIVNEDVSAVTTRLLPGAGLDFLAKCVKIQN